MRTASAAILVLLGLNLLCWAMIDAAHLPTLALVGIRGDDAVRLLPVFTLGFAGLGLLLSGLGVRSLWRGDGAIADWGPWVVAASRVAAEHGQGLAISGREGMCFEAVRDGMKVSFQALPDAQGGRVVIHGNSPGRMRILIGRHDEMLRVNDPTLTPVGEGENWLFYASLPVLARAFLNDGAVVSALNRYFSEPDAVTLSHSQEGSEVFMRLPAADIAERRFREGVNLLAFLRRLNG